LQHHDLLNYRTNHFKINILRKLKIWHWWQFLFLSSPSQKFF
jgi:hypothetical protein